MSTIGYGESRPIGNNKTSKGRADSRRVNINRSANVKVN
jgi:outer membrane protein OmpA-like peptidoglycan-associated protein